MNIKDFPLMAQILWLLAKESGFIRHEYADLLDDFTCALNNECTYPLHLPDCPFGMLREARKEGLFGEPRQDMPYPEIIAALKVGDVVEVKSEAGEWIGVIVSSDKDENILCVDGIQWRVHFYRDNADSALIGSALYASDIRITGHLDAKALERMTE